jgi:hypothetical protein
LVILVEDKDTKQTDVNITGFPRGFAILSYANAYGGYMDSRTTGYIVLKNVMSPLAANKGQRVGEIPIIGRNTDVMQSMGGKGLVYPSIRFLLKDESVYEMVDGVAYQTMLKLAGWCDAGEPLFFAYEKMIRRVLIFDYGFTEVKSNHWFDCTLTLKKYVPIEPLMYQRTIVDLAPFPELPEPLEPGQSGGDDEDDDEDEEEEEGSGEGEILDPDNPPEETNSWSSVSYTEIDGTKGWVRAGKKNNGEIDCIPHKLTEKDLEGSIYDIIKKYYGTIDVGEGSKIELLISRLARDNGIDLTELFYNTESLDGIPPSKLTICIPRKVQISHGGVSNTITVND